MTELTGTTVANTRTVEGFLNALQDADYDAAGAALAASRELHDELIEVLGETDFGIGVSAGRAIAGHIGAQARFEYTVIGDPVNEAARLTELAKLETGHVLASAIAVSGALDAEALCWDVDEVVELQFQNYR